MKMEDEFILSEFTFAKLGISDRVHTDLALKDVLDIFIKYGHQKYTYDEKRNKIILEKNFAVKLNTERLESDSFVTLEFYRYYHRFYAVYVIIAVIASFIVEFNTPGVKPGFFALIFFMLPILLIGVIFEMVRGIKGIKKVDYPKEADKIFIEISNSIPEKNLYLKNRDRKSTRSFSLKRIITSDYGAFTSAVLILLFGVMYLIADFGEVKHVKGIGLVPFIGDSLSIQQEVFLVITLLATFIFVRRVHLFHTLYKRGQEISGTIIYARNQGRDDRVDYEYSFQNEKYLSGNYLTGEFLWKKSYYVGDEVVLLVDPEKPKRAVIKDIYF